MDKAFLPEYQRYFNIVEIFGMGIALIAQLCIGALAYSKSRRSESEIGGELVLLFCLSFTFAVLCTSSALVATAYRMAYNYHFVTLITYSIISSFFYGSFLFLLLLNLVTRLHITFQDSALHAMSTNTVYSFVSIAVILLILGILFVLGLALRYFVDKDVGWTLFVSASFIGSFFYVVGCTLAVRQFVMNLTTIAKMQACSYRRELCLNPEDFSLNEKQIILLNVSAKYILLFFVAILSTVLDAIFFFTVSSFCGGLFASFDLCVNLQCVYLQFAVASSDYRKCCGFPDSCCRAVVLKRARREMLTDVRNERAMHHCTNEK